MQFTISDAARSQLEQLATRQSGGAFMRISVLGGGCSGFEYRFEFEQEQKPEDHLFLLPEGKVSVIIDPVSAPFLEGATLHYSHTIGKAGFQVINPLADSHCGCGKSFSLDPSRLM